MVIFQQVNFFMSVNIRILLFVTIVVNLTHIIVTCSRLSELFQLTKDLLRKLIPIIDTIPFWWYIIGIPAGSGLDVNVRRLGNWIFAQAKMAIVYSRFHKNRSSGTQCVVTLFKAIVI